MFWIFIGLVILATTYQEIEERKLRAGLLQAALEKGDALDPELLERLFPGDKVKPERNPTNPRNIRIAAIVVASIGVGLGVLALALKQVEIKAFWVILGLSGLTLTTSVGIYLASRMTDRVAAFVIASIGVGLGVMSLAARQIEIDAFWIFLGLGGLTLAVGAGIYVASRIGSARELSNGSFPKSPT